MVIPAIPTPWFKKLRDRTSCEGDSFEHSKS